MTATATSLPVLRRPLQFFSYILDSHQASASMMRPSQCIHLGETCLHQKLTTAR